MAQEENISPEEKLLKVIQEGDGADEQSSAAATDDSSSSAKATEDKPQATSDAASEAPVKVVKPAKVKPAPAAEEKPAKAKVAKPAKAKPAVAKKDEAADAATAEAAAEESEKKSKLKVKKGKKKAEKKPEDGEAKAKPGMIGTAAMAPVKRHGGPRLTLSAVNGALATAAAIMLLLSAWEIWAAIKPEGGDESGQPGQVQGPDGSRDGAVEKPYMLDRMLAIWRENNKIRTVDEPARVTPPPVGPDRRPPPVQQARTPWSDYLKKNVHYSGKGGTADEVEIMLKDASSQRLYHVPVGGEFLMNMSGSGGQGGGQVKLRLDKFDNNRAYISDGSVTVEVL